MHDDEKVNKNWDIKCQPEVVEKPIMSYIICIYELEYELFIEFFIQKYKVKDCQSSSIK